MRLSELGALPPDPILGLIALVLATINVVGGFLVTDRMLRMFRSREERKGS